jgi:glycosyltransferase involved in cell wall biosynthesis
MKKKILLISDDISSATGVGNIAKDFVVNSCHHYDFVNIGGAIQHPLNGQRIDISKEINKLANIDNSNVIVYPANGYGDINLVKLIIEKEQIDAILLITDPRYFTWLFQFENEIRKTTPIMYLNIWDSPIPYPVYNTPYYESCDLLMAISKQTKNINKVLLDRNKISHIDLDNNKNYFFENDQRSTPIILSYVPHGRDENIFKPLNENDEGLQLLKSNIFNEEPDFVLFFNSKNIRRKQIPDLMWAFKLFLDKLPKEKAKKCFLILHTKKVEEHGTDLEAVKEYFFDDDYSKNVLFSTQQLLQEHLNILYNIADGTILLSNNEGWGLSITESLLAGTPFIANVQGGMIDQMRFIDENNNWINYTKDFPTNAIGKYKNHGEWAYPVFPSNISIQGSPMTPYISDDRCDVNDVANKIMELYNTPKNIRKRNGLLGREWAIGDEAQFTSEKMSQKMIKSIDYMFDKWKPREKIEIININERPNMTIK